MAYFVREIDIEIVESTSMGLQQSAQRGPLRAYETIANGVPLIVRGKASEYGIHDCLSVHLFFLRKMHRSECCQKPLVCTLCGVMIS